MEDKRLYTLVRIPKSGSRSLAKMVEKSLPSSHHFEIPQLNIDPTHKLHPAERFRARRRILRGLLKFRALTTGTLWRNISRLAGDGDILSGHMPYGTPQLPGWKLEYITLLRDPVERVVSEYYYSRKGYLSRPHWRRMYHKGHAEVTGTRSFPEYLEYLCRDMKRFGNPSLKYVTGTDSHPAPLSFLKEHYLHFGILERMDLFTTQLAEKLEAPVGELWENKSSEEDTYQPSAGDLKLLHTLLGRDIDFYQEVKEFILSSCS